MQVDHLNVTLALSPVSYWSADWIYILYSYGTISSKKIHLKKKYNIKMNTVRLHLYLGYSKYKKASRTRIHFYPSNKNSTSLVLSVFAVYLWFILTPSLRPS